MMNKKYCLVNKCENIECGIYIYKVYYERGQFLRTGLPVWVSVNIVNWEGNYIKVPTPLLSSLRLKSLVSLSIFL